MLFLKKIQSGLKRLQLLVDFSIPRAMRHSFILLPTKVFRDILTKLYALCMIAMAIIHFMYTNEKRVVSIVRAAQRKPVERQPKHPMHAGRDGERPQDECSFSFYYNRKSPKPHRSNGLSPSRPHGETSGGTAQECRKQALHRRSQ